MKEELMRLNYRVADLEERLCPCESHDWVATGHYLTASVSGYNIDVIYKYKCHRCGKTKESYC